MMMNSISCVLFSLLILSSSGMAEESVGRQFLSYEYGQEGIPIEKICLPNDDLWFLRGNKNEEALSLVKEMKLETKPTGVVSGTVWHDIYIVETRDGKVDPTLNVQAISQMHRTLVLSFIFSVLSQDAHEMGQRVTDASKVKVEGMPAEVASGDYEQYGMILNMLPVCRSSKPADDAKSHTVTYRVPLGNEIMSVTLVKKNSNWLIDTSKGLRVPMEFFFRKQGE